MDQIVEEQIQINGLQRDDGSPYVNRNAQIAEEIVQVEQERVYDRPYYTIPEVFLELVCLAALVLTWVYFFVLYNELPQKVELYARNVYLVGKEYLFFIPSLDSLVYLIMTISQLCIDRIEYYMHENITRDEKLTEQENIQYYILKRTFVMIIKLYILLIFSFHIFLWLEVSYLLYITRFLNIIIAFFIYFLVHCFFYHYLLFLYGTIQESNQQKVRFRIIDIFPQNILYNQYRFHILIQYSFYKFHDGGCDIYQNSNKINDQYKVYETNQIQNTYSHQGPQINESFIYQTSNEQQMQLIKNTAEQEPPQELKQMIYVLFQYFYWLLSAYHSTLTPFIIRKFHKYRMQDRCKILLKKKGS